MLCLELTNHCNLKCPMCTLGTMDRPKGFMEPALFQKAVDESRYYDMPIDWFHVFGEPLLHPKIEALMEYFWSYGHGYGGISTNGLILNNHRIDVLTRFGRGVLVAVDSLRPEVYAELRANTRFEEMCDKVKRLIAAAAGTDLHITIQCLRTRLNPDEELESFENFFGRHPHVTYFFKTTEQFAGGADYTVEHMPRLPKQGCPKIKTFLGVLSNGSTVSCCYDVDAIQPVGNLRSSTLQELWHGELRRQQLVDSASGDFSKLPLCEQCEGATG